MEEVEKLPLRLGKIPLFGGARTLRTASGLSPSQKARCTNWSQPRKEPFAFLTAPPGIRILPQDILIRVEFQVRMDGQKGLRNTETIEGTIPALLSYGNMVASLLRLKIHNAQEKAARMVRHFCCEEPLRCAPKLVQFDRGL